MTGRSLTSMVLAAMGCGLPAVLPAQSYGPAGQVVTLPPEAGGFGGAYASPSFGDSGGAAGYGGAMSSGGYGDPACPPQGYAADCPPQPTGRWPMKCRPLFINPKLLEPPRGTYVRLEYLSWGIEKPGAVLLGAPITPDEGETDPFAPARDNTTSDGFALQQGGFGYVPSIDEFRFAGNDGARLTFGIPLNTYGTFEGSFWLLEQASDHYEYGGRFLLEGVTVTFAPTTPVAVDGVNPAAGAGTFRVYDLLEVDYESDMWGSDARFVVDALSPPGEGFKLRPLFGFKYVGLQEAMHQKGVFVSGTPAFDTSIDSDTDNTILGGTAGLRAELEHRWFVLGIEPAVTFAGNIARSKVVTERFLGPTDPRTESNSNYFEFSPILDLKTYARVKLNDSMSVHVGYDAFWLSRVYRAANVIEYGVATDPSTGLRNEVGTKRDTDSVGVDGLSVGVEFVF